MRQRASVSLRRAVKRERRKYGRKRGMDNPLPARTIPAHSVRAKEDGYNGVFPEWRIRDVLPQVQNRKDGKSIWIPCNRTAIEIRANDTVESAMERWQIRIKNGVSK